MFDLGEFIRQPAERSNKADISLSGWLEAFAGNYFVYGEGGGDREFHWHGPIERKNAERRTEL